MLHKIYVLIVIQLFFSGVFLCVSAQFLEPDELRDKKNFFSLQEALLQPDSVFKLTLGKKKLKEIPPEVFTFSNLRVLNLGRNKITEIPADIAKLHHLQELDVHGNKLERLPAEIGMLTQLTKLKLNRNSIVALPPEIGNLVNLEIIEMWDNEVSDVPDEVRNLVHLKVLELRGILFSYEEQRRIQSLVPQAKVYFSPGCACK